MITRSNQYRTQWAGLPLGLLLGLGLHANPAQLQQTQNKLNQLNVQISQLQHTLTTAHDKRGILNKELAVTEKQIGQGISKLRGIQKNMDEKTFKIAALQKQINELTTQLAQQQHLLAHHVRARYQMGEYQALKWLINQDNPHQISRILTYYQYIIRSRQQLIDRIDTTRQHLKQSKEILKQELALNQKLRKELTHNQQQLGQNKIYHQQLIYSLNHEIQNKQNSLHEAQRNKNNLARLLKSLSQQSIIPVTVPFLQMRKKLPFPVQSPSRSLQKMNQGVTFFADEGTPVTAIYPGKVVFSDWLKGYGLLLIIDHGQGFMSLYAHNQALFKRKGQSVHQNEQIASIGHTGGIKQNGLYFEIRLKGKAISPLAWLS